MYSWNCSSVIVLFVSSQEMTSSPTGYRSLGSGDEIASIIVAADLIRCGSVFRQGVECRIQVSKHTEIWRILPEGGLSNDAVIEDLGFYNARLDEDHFDPERPDFVLQRFTQTFQRKFRGYISGHAL